MLNLKSSNSGVTKGSYENLQRKKLVCAALEYFVLSEAVI